MLSSKMKRTLRCFQWYSRRDVLAVGRCLMCRSKGTSASHTLAGAWHLPHGDACYAYSSHICFFNIWPKIKLPLRWPNNNENTLPNNNENTLWKYKKKNPYANFNFFLTFKGILVVSLFVFLIFSEISNYLLTTS